MWKSALYLYLVFLPVFCSAQVDGLSERVHSVVDSSHEENVVLIQSFEVEAPAEAVWRAYTTKEGMESWAAPVAEVELKINGWIKTSYNKDATIGDSSTITLNIINFVPGRMLTLQAELTGNFPQFMQDDQKDLFNTVLFESVGPGRTEVTSYGIGYKKNEKYMPLLKFFIIGNEKSYQNLIQYLETGEPSIKY